MKKERAVGFALIILAVLFLGFYFDAELISGIAAIRTKILNDFFLGINFLSSELLIFFFLTSIFLFREKRKYILPLWFSLICSAVLGFILKVTIQRQRPYQLGIVSILPAFEKASHLIWNFSFPSFHTMLAFCAVPMLSKAFPRLKYLWIAFACLIGFSRMYFGVHFLSDVLAGAVLGTAIGMIILKLEKQNNFSEKIYERVFRR